MTLTTTSVSGVQQGWQCPICSKVWAPWVKSCDCNGTYAIKINSESTDWKATAVPCTVYNNTTAERRVTV